MLNNVEVKLYSGVNGRIEYGMTEGCPKKCFSVLSEGQIVDVCVFYKRTLQGDVCNSNKED